jgi:hypothetical protein
MRSIACPIPQKPRSFQQMEAEAKSVAAPMHDLTDDDRARLKLIAERNALSWRRSLTDDEITFLRKLAQHSSGDETEPPFITALAQVWKTAMCDPGRFVTRHFPPDEPIEDLVDWQWRALMAALPGQPPQHSSGDQGLREPRFTVEQFKAVLASNELVDEVADEWSEGEEGLHPSFVRNLLASVFDTIAIERLAALTDSTDDQQEDS